MSEHQTGNGRRVFNFDPTINLGHLLTAGVFLSSTIAAWVSLDGRVEQQAKDLDRVDRVNRTETIRVETVLMTRINDDRSRLDQTLGRTAEDIRDIKTIVRDGFRDLDQKMDKKIDKPGR